MLRKFTGNYIYILISIRRFAHKIKLSLYFNLCTCRDPRQKRLQKAEDEKAEKTKRDGAKLSFQEKMKLFAVEAGEKTPNRDKAKISRAQRDLEDDGSGNEEFEEDCRTQDQ